MTLTSLPNGYTAAVFGASGGIGRALTEQLAEDPRCRLVHAGTRSSPPPANPGVAPFTFDLTDEASIARAVENLGDPDLVIVATGVLHDEALKPEKALRSLDAVALARAFALNAIGPALIARHVLAKAPRNRRMLFAALSAKVGSISDNRLGGWHSYRASKAALNQIIRTLSVELARTHPQCVCVALHPGTVDTGLSRPFQAGVSAERLFSPEHAVRQLLAVLDGLTPDVSGRLIGWDGQEILP
jgi:NAD(P)-dependent dehydrogenase (short-subunit alcohol dehydrogenase family)